MNVWIIKAGRYAKGHENDLHMDLIVCSTKEAVMDRLNHLRNGDILDSDFEPVDINDFVVDILESVDGDILADVYKKDGDGMFYINAYSIEVDG